MVFSFLFFFGCISPQMITTLHPLELMEGNEFLHIAFHLLEQTEECQEACSSKLDHDGDVLNCFQEQKGTTKTQQKIQAVFKRVHGTKPHADALRGPRPLLQLAPRWPKDSKNDAG